MRYIYCSGEYTDLPLLYWILSCLLCFANAAPVGYLQHIVGLLKYFLYGIYPFHSFIFMPKHW